jgi:fructose-1,6-bisphosphatase I
MNDALRLESYLDMCVARKAQVLPVCRAVLELSNAGRRIAKILARGSLAGVLSGVVGESIDGDGQKTMDVMTHDIVRDALREAGVKQFASEEALEFEILDPNGSIAVAVDPLDGSSNIDTLAPIGTIFSILPAQGENPFFQTGRTQLAAGFLIYGPQTALVLTIGEGTRIFTLDPETGTYMASGSNIAVPADTKEYAINSSNQRHWEPEMRAYIGELIMGAGGPRGQDFNTRWLASMVGDAFRILVRGGIYLYPGDYRRGYARGRLRLIYEANPIAMLMEQAGAAATDGRKPILDIVPADLHQRSPLVFGSINEVARVTAAYLSPTPQESPLFQTRSLFRKGAVAAASLI